MHGSQPFCGRQIGIVQPTRAETRFIGRIKIYPEGCRRRKDLKRSIQDKISDNEFEFVGQNLQRNHQSRANTKHQQLADLKQHESPGV